MMTQVSNVCDRGYIGIRKTISLLSPYLERVEKNPCATLITLFINAAKEVMKASDATGGTMNTDVLFRYISPHSLFPPSPNGAGLTRLWDARDLAADAEMFFQR